MVKTSKQKRRNGGRTTEARRSPAEVEVDEAAQTVTAAAASACTNNSQANMGKQKRGNMERDRGLEHTSKKRRKSIGAGAIDEGDEHIANGEGMGHVAIPISMQAVSRQARRRPKHKPLRFSHPQLESELRRLRRPWLCPDDALFDAVLKCSYRGMSAVPRDGIPSAVHKGFRRSFDELHAGGLFLYDMVQAGGKRLSRTFVTRTLIGDAGITYKYLGLRLFAHPWDATDDIRKGPGDDLADQLADPCIADLFRSGEQGSDDERPARQSQIRDERSLAATLEKVRSLSEWMRARAARLLNEGRGSASVFRSEGGYVAPSEAGSCRFNLTLINRMESSATKVDLKPDPLFAMGKCSVSWHADSCLQDFSTIGVYHCTEPVTADAEWSIALRVSQEAEEAESMLAGNDSPGRHKRKSSANKKPTDAGAKLEAVRTPPLLVPLRSGDAYFLLDDFNHFHEHAVVAGSSSLRYSSTHRVASTEGNTFSHVQSLCEEVLGGTSPDISGGAEVCHPIIDVAQVRAEQELLTEIESEWLMQFWVQGRRHAVLHRWWRGPMALVLATWRELERRTAVTARRLLSFGHALHDCPTGDSGEVRGSPEPSAIAKAFDTVLRSLEERREARSRWTSRFSDAAYRPLSADCAPVFPALWRKREAGVEDWTDEGLLPHDLRPVISRLRNCYKQAYRAACGGEKAGSARAIASGAASNWEIFQASSLGGRGKERQPQQQQNCATAGTTLKDSSTCKGAHSEGGRRKNKPERRRGGKIKKQR